MNRQIRPIVSRRRAFSLLGLAAALSFAVPMVLTASDADAETAGMERRQERRGGRHERRTERRTVRHERRTERRGGSTAPHAPEEPGD
jgi:Ni/Co efflux regulator RcnB